MIPSMIPIVDNTVNDTISQRFQKKNHTSILNGTKIRIIIHTSTSIINPPKYFSFSPGTDYSTSLVETENPYPSNQAKDPCWKGGILS